MSSSLTPSDVSVSYGGMLANSVYQTALVTGLLIAYARITKLITKSATPS